MKIFKPDEITIYDNLYVKPSQNGCASQHSMAVSFSVDRILYYGIYCFTTGIWSTCPSDEKRREFKDRVVEYWFYPPGSIDLFKKYANGVHKGEYSDDISRIQEFSEIDDGTRFKETDILTKL